MQKTITPSRFIAIVVVVLVLVVSFVAVTVRANPSGFPIAARTSSATTTPSFMTAGTGTSTLAYDAYGAYTSPTYTSAYIGNTMAADSAVLLVQYTGSSTASTLGIAFEYSQDGIDWYNDRLSAGATTTVSVNLNTPTTYNMGFSSSSVQGGVIGTTSVNSRVLSVPTPTRFVRAVFTTPAGSLNGAVWAQWVPRKQVSN